MARAKQIVDLSVSVKFEKQAPFPRDALNKALEDRGYTINVDNNSPLVVQQPGKQILYDINEGILQMDLSENEDVPQGLEELQEILVNTIEVDETDISGVELSTKQLVWSGKETADMFSGFYPQIDFGDIFTHDAKPFGLRYVSESGYGPTEQDTYDIRIEPYVQNTDYYYIQLSHRKPTFESMIELSEELEDTLDQIVKKVEEQGEDNE